MHWVIKLMFVVSGKVLSPSNVETFESQTVVKGQN